MKRIKIILESKYTIFIFIIFTLIYSVIRLNSSINYNASDTYVIKHIKYTSEKVSILTNHVLINYYGDIDLKVGDSIKVEGVYSIPSSNTNFNMFNYNLYLKGKNIYYVCNASKIDVISHSNNVFYKIKNKIMDKINSYDNKEYLYAFILGDNNYIDSEVKLSFQDNGISHLFSISGMHVTLLSMVILSILNRIKKCNINYIVVIVFLSFYSFLVNFTPSMMRASMMFILLFINKITKLDIKVYKLFIYLTCLFIIFNPYYVYNIGFLFSFSITFSLILFGGNRYNYFVKLFMTSLIAFISSIPILINNFYSINLLSPIINLIFVPFISFIIFPLSMISFLIKPFELLLSFFLNILEKLSLFISKYGLNIILCHVPFYIVILYYLIIFIVLYNIKREKYKYLVILLLILIIHTNIVNMKDEVHILNVGQGDSILIRLNGKTYLIDTGGNRNYDLSDNVLIPYFKSFGVKKIDQMIITHGDFDHMGEAIDLVNNFRVNNVIFNCGSYNDLEKELIEILDKKEIKHDKCINRLDDFYFLQTQEYDNENDSSNVIYIEINGYKFMFMGDASITTEKGLMNKYNLPNIDVLKVGHHGSRTSSSKDFINDINPKYSIISVGKNNRYGHPNKEVLDNLEKSKIYRTDENGSIMFKIKNNKLKIETCSP